MGFAGYVCANAPAAANESSAALHSRKARRASITGRIASLLQDGAFDGPPQRTGIAGPTSSRSGDRRAMRAQERVHLADRDRDAVLRILPRKETHLGVRREHYRFHRDR